jgi:hypothetical protein
MTNRNRLIGTLCVFIVAAQNYVSQISHIPTAQVALWSLHEWVGACLNVAIAAAVAWKAFLSDSNFPTKTP